MKYKCFKKDERQELCTETPCSSASLNVTSDIASLRVPLFSRFVCSFDSPYSKPCDPAVRQTPICRNQ